MAEGRWRLWVASIALCVSILAAACGTYHPNKIPFHFTPIPVTALPDGTPVSIGANCSVFNADEVVVTLDPGQRKAFESWLDRFSVRHLGPTGQPLTVVLLLIAVPLGSVRDAIDVIKAQPGVRSAEINGYAHLPEDTPIGERFFGCKAPS